MKTRIILFSLFAILYSFASTAQKTSATATPFKTAELQAAGLTCSMCTRAINDALEDLPFIKTVQTNIKTSSFQITFKDDQVTDFDAIKTAVEDAGFSVASLKVSGDFEKTGIQKDAHIKIGNQLFHFLDIKDQDLKGEKTLTLVDKGFVTSGTYKKYSATTSMNCVKTGRTESCCTKTGRNIGTGERIYHVTI